MFLSISPKAKVAIHHHVKTGESPQFQLGPIIQAELCLPVFFLWINLLFFFNQGNLLRTSLFQIKTFNVHFRMQCLACESEAGAFSDFRVIL